MLKFAIKDFEEVLTNYNNFAENVENAKIKTCSPKEAQELIETISVNTPFIDNQKVNNKLEEIYLNYNN